MTVIVNPTVAAAIAGLSCSSSRSDCLIQFVIAAAVADSDDRSKTRRVHRTLGDVLPGHMFVLCEASEWFQAQVSLLPVDKVFRVRLDSEADEQAARAAISFCYTGQVSVNHVHHVMQMRRIAGTLRIAGCVDACDAWLLARLRQPKVHAAWAAAEAVAVDGVFFRDLPFHEALLQSAAITVIRFFSFRDLPGPGDVKFVTVQAAAREALLREFGDVPVVLNSRILRMVMPALSPLAMHMLLGSDALRTDSEDSVLMMLVFWLKVNEGACQPDTRHRLCRLIRLVQLRHVYLDLVLPALAAEYERSGTGFAIDDANVAYISKLAKLARRDDELARRDDELARRDDELARRDDELARQSLRGSVVCPWYSFAPRSAAPCVSYVSEVPHEWTISEEELRRAVDAAGRNVDAVAFARAAFRTGFGDGIVAQGVKWVLSVGIRHGAPTAALYMTPCLDLPGPATTLPDSIIQAVIVSVLQKKGCTHDLESLHELVFHPIAFETVLFTLNAPTGHRDALLLQGEGDEDDLARWRPYLIDGKITGSIML
ncbi:hypothetical protein TSOC_012318 [Tetrabaena socialis]|uniref:BTB domain-containing protein n=1 Tax=Tetrabaena socialis TaxID=47790 RepID=A0A2J7ZNC5_9CHLO|nr:hypothetical protein TSOC_012318 [Tetrabaena socialis]|eukprot:PNH01758.1 hypothetical protein TSOC_012318 [Tetrabaena socialis]